MITGLALAGCGGGGGDDGGSPNPPAPPPPPPPSGVPPLSANAINISGGQQIGVDRWSPGNTSTGGNGQAVGGIECLPTMPDNYHVHSHVAVFLNGQQLSVPNDVGIVSTGSTPCFYTIHTHDKSGKIHVEAAQQGTFTLGQLFDIWGQPLSSSDVAGLSGMSVKIYVTDNGTVTEAATATWRDIELRSHRLITIVVGTAITEIPNYTWSGN